MTYRPKDWKLPIGIADKSLKKNHTYKLILSGKTDKRYSMSLLTERDKNLFEAGADAMLESLRCKKEHLSGADLSGVVSQLFKNLTNKGVWVFIPDKE